MISSNDIKNGNVIEYDGQLCQVLEFQHVLQNKIAYVRVKLKNLRTGATYETALKGSDSKVKLCFIDKIEMQYLYSSGDSYTFMNTETYEQIELQASTLEWEKNFLIEGETVKIISYEGEILGLTLPDKVTLEVTKCDPAVKGDTKTNALKDAYVSTGLLIKVPMFVEQGEKVIVSTATGKYDSRA